MTIDMEGAARKKVAIFMPKAIDEVLQSYYDFLCDKGKGNDSRTREKKFAEHHSACKIALSHLELLIKIASMAKLETGEQGIAAQLLLQARSETNTYRGEMVPDKDDDDYQESS